MSSLFTIYFSKDFIEPEVAAKYNKYIKRKKWPYSDIVDLINASIVEFSFPGVNIDSLRNEYYTRRSNVHPYQTLDRDISVQLKQVEGNIVMFAIIESAIRKWRKTGSQNTPVGNMYFELQTLKNFSIFKTSFLNCVLETSDLFDIDYTDTSTSMETFSINLKWNDIKMDVLT